MQKNVIPLIEGNYSNLTDTEKEIANYFISNTDINFSAKEVSNKIHVSISALTRFAKKCGFSGYREFIYEYEMTHKKIKSVSGEITKRVLNDYEELLNKTYSLVDEKKLKHATQLLNTSKIIYIYGKGSSGLVADEMKLRFMRLGINCDSISDEDIMKMNNALLNETTLVIGISVSGKKKATVNSLKRAKERNSKTILITANQDPYFLEFCDEVINIAVKENLSNGNIISPQFPVLVMVDIFYAYLLKSNEMRKRIFNDTLYELEIRNENSGN